MQTYCALRLSYFTGLLNSAVAPLNSLTLEAGNPNNPKLRKKKPILDAEAYLEGIRSGDRVLLSQAITLVESLKAEHAPLAREVVEACLPYSGRSIRLGITGAPGVGKSSFIEAMGMYLIDQGLKVAVLAIDPSSKQSRGSILGDKTRMNKLSAQPDAFIRPSPAGESLGGVARKTRETILLCEAAGFEAVIVETVGVGQSETAVHSMVDFFLLLLLPGAGDELQGIKRGIVEMADLIAVNKADGERMEMAREARRAYRSAMHLFPPKESGWDPPVILCSALLNQGMKEIWDQVRQYQTFAKEKGYFKLRRQEQAKYWLMDYLHEKLSVLFFEHPAIREQWDHIEHKVINGEWSSLKAGERLLGLFKN
ncbi:MAG: methylmalonyl Co-A mutase-associated GTPase MeaB [Saprospirales bacterium]|nr:methylmalonyl Co-A mutase-associated GTPase MeaB [Saprospirales bacterium]